MSPGGSIMKTKGMSRRQFLGGVTGTCAAAIGFPYIVRSSALGQGRSIAPSERVVMGCIGLGSQGENNLNAFIEAPDVQIVAICDVEKGSDLYYDGETYGLERAKRKVDDYYAKNQRVFGLGGCRAYEDFREVLERTDINAVTVSTPDHWHALISILAARSGKDVYCEKPLANSVLEGRELCEAIRQSGRVLQTGSLERSNDSVRFACELVQNGRIGKLHTIHVNMPTSDPLHQQVRDMAGRHPDMAAPSSLNYDMWLGPAPEAPYTENRTHFWWRYIFDYGGGEISCQGADLLDIAQLGNNSTETSPIEISAKGKRLPEGLFDIFMEYEFELKYDNGVKLIGSDKGVRGVKFEGEDGWIFININDGVLEAEPESLLKEVIEPDEIKLGRSPGHHRDFLDAVKNRTETVAPAEVGHRTASICHLINIAMLRQERLEYNPRMERITNSYEADSFLTKPFRSPWYI